MREREREKFMEEWYHLYLLLQKIERGAKGVWSLLYVVCRAPHLLCIFFSKTTIRIITCFAVPLDITD
jgi:hypothetical protein